MHHRAGVIVLGMLFIVGGAWLALLKGSGYYLIAGLSLCISGVQFSCTDAIPSVLTQGLQHACVVLAVLLGEPALLGLAEDFSGDLEEFLLFLAQMVVHFM